MFMETVEDHVLLPLRNMTKITCLANVVSLIYDSNSESESEEVSNVFTNPPPTIGYEPHLHLYSDPYPIFKVECLTFRIPTKKY